MAEGVPKRRRGSARYHRVLRGLRPDRNPLRRTSDRVETCLLAGLFVAAAAGAPFAAQAASHAEYASALRAEQSQVASTYQVRAILTQPAGAATNGYTLSAFAPVQATWTSVTGIRQSGQVLAPDGSPKGSTVTVWTDAAGDLTSPPMQPSQVSYQSALAAVVAVFAVAAACLCGAVIARYVLNKRRMAAWEAGWIVSSRAWSRQRW
jgi:hypothetical protein